MTAAGVRHPGEFRWETRLLATVTLFLTAIGIAVCYAAGTYREDWYQEASQQLSGAIIGGIAFVVAARIDYQVWRKAAKVMFYGIVILLGMIAVVSLVWYGRRAPGAIEALVPRINGARRWIRLAGLQLQISELARIVLPVMVAAVAADLGKRITEFKRGYLELMKPVAIIAVLVVAQPNYSMAGLLAMTGLTVAFVAGARFGHIFLTVAGAAAAGAALIMISPVRLMRFQPFLQPSLECDSELQVCDSLIGFGSGGLLGVGFGKGTQKLGHLSYGYSDFILSVLAEEWGLVGVLAVTLCFVVFCWMGFRIARTARDLFGTALAGSLTATVGIGAFMHAAVVTKLMPATGLPLPFISAGRLSLVVYLLAAGILVSIGRQRGRPAARS